MKTLILSQEELLAIRNVVFAELTVVSASSALEAALQSAMAKLIVAIHEGEDGEEK